MRKTIILLLIIGCFYLFVSNVMAEKVTIPDDALRIRVVPNSNSDYDQEIKGKVCGELEVTMYDMLKEADSSEEARSIIKDNLEQIKVDVGDVLKNNNYDKPFEVNFGYNYFPEKEYKGVTYDEGYYESLLVTLGEGKGDNWWCVLFPPLCLIEADENTDVEYKSLVKELIDKYF